MMPKRISMLRTYLQSLKLQRDAEKDTIPHINVVIHFCYRMQATNRELRWDLDDEKDKRHFLFVSRTCVRMLQEDIIRSSIESTWSRLSLIIQQASLRTCWALRRLDPLIAIDGLFRTPCWHSVWGTGTRKPEPFRLRIPILSPFLRFWRRLQCRRTVMSSYRQYSLWARFVKQHWFACVDLISRNETYQNCTIVPCGGREIPVSDACY
jgi:hypothetical protein